MPTAELKMEELLPFFGVDGHVHIYEHRVPGDLEGNEATVIRTDQDWSCLFHWRAWGELTCVLCGQWHGSIFLEAMGVREYDLPDNEFRIDFVRDDPHSYSYRLRVPAGRVPPGIYRVVACLTLEAEDGGGPVAGFAEGPLIKFYRPC